MGTGHRVCKVSRNDTRATGCKSMLWYACMIHENRDLVVNDVKMLIRAAAVAFTS